MPRLHHAQVDVAAVDALDRAAGRAAQEDRACQATGRAAHLGKTLHRGVDPIGLGMVAVHLGQHGPPLPRQQAVKLIAQRTVAQRHGGGHDQGAGVVLAVQVADAIRHHSQHPARALELRDGRPVRVEPVKNFRVDGIAVLQPLQVSVFADPGRILPAVLTVHAGKGLASAVALGRIQLVAEQPAAHHGERLADFQGLPNRFDAPENVLQSRECFLPGVAAQFHVAFRQGDHQYHIGRAADRLAEGLQESIEVALVRARHIADVRHQFVHQNEGWADRAEQIVELRAARGRAFACGPPDDLIRLLSAQLIRHLAPKRVARVPAWRGSRIRGREVRAIQNRDRSLGDVTRSQSRFCDEGRDFPAALRGVVEQGVRAVDQVVQGDEAVGLAPAEPGLGLNHRVSAIAAEPLERVHEQGANAGGDVRLPEEVDRVAILRGQGAPVMHLLEIRGKFGFLERAQSHVRTRGHDVSPGLEVDR